MRRVVLASRAIKLGVQPLEVDPCRALESRNCYAGTDESMATQRRELRSRSPVSGHDKGLAIGKLAHDFAAIVAQLALGDFGRHMTILAPVS